MPWCQVSTVRAIVICLMIWYDLNNGLNGCLLLQIHRVALFLLGGQDRKAMTCANRQAPFISQSHHCGPFTLLPEAEIVFANGWNFFLVILGKKFTYKSIIWPRFFAKSPPLATPGNLPLLWFHVAFAPAERPMSIDSKVDLTGIQKGISWNKSKWHIMT